MAFWTKNDALDLTDLCYAMLDDTNACQDFFESIQLLFGDSMLCLQMWDDEIEIYKEQIIYRGYEEGSLEDYTDYYYSVNPFLPILATRESGDVQLLSDLIPESRMASEEFMHDFQNKRGNHLGVVATILKEDNRYGALAIDGPKHSNQHWRELAELIRVVTPHLRRVMDISRKFKDLDLQKRLAGFSLDAISARVLVVDRRSKLVFANSQGMELLSQRDLLALGNQGQVMAKSNTQTDQIRKLVDSVTTRDVLSPDRAGGFLKLRRADGSAEVAMIVPLPRGIQKSIGLAQIWSKNSSQAVIIVNGPDAKGRISTQFLKLQYGFTKTEAALAVCLCEGGSLKSYCKAHHVSVNTARTHLKSIFQKIGVSQQSELVSVLVGNVPRYSFGQQ